ncbi:MAG: S10 family peptidase [Spirochaeta sp.]
METEIKRGASSSHSIDTESGTIRYMATADWIVLRKNEKPIAEMFYVSYVAESDTPRPLTFVFNGGPGASSAYLHLGALGPQRGRFTENGQAPPPPYRLCDNESTWLEFTDLVFIDPIGTGFSRMIGGSEETENSKTSRGANTNTDTAEGSLSDSSKADGKRGNSGTTGSIDSAGAADQESSEYWQLKRDLESLCEGICSYLSVNHRWESTVYLAGESYGGFRTAKLSKLLQKDYGVGLAGVIIISPALEFTLLDGSDYDALMWVDTFPTMAAAAWIHGRARKVQKNEPMRDYMRRAAQFAVKDLLPVLAAGDMFGTEQRDRILNQAADYIGLPRETLRKKGGRIAIDYYVKNLLRDQNEYLGLYDAAISSSDPYPDRDNLDAPDPTLHQVSRVFAAGINTQLRKHIGLQTERDYNLLSQLVNTSWKIDTRKHALESQVGATDDLRYGMSLNPDMQVFICHGIFDLVTPWFAAERITRLMKLTDEQRARLSLKYYDGGHMFYTWDSSRSAFRDDVRELYTRQ